MLPLYVFLVQGPVQPKPVLTYFQQSFVFRTGAKKVVIPVQAAPPKKPLFVAFRKDATWAVWDDRGLTIRIGKKVKSFKLGEVAVSPRVQSREDILHTLELIKEGGRKKAASALSGARRIGSSAYFLVRWEDSPGKPWLEALVRVDLTAIKPTWGLMGRFEGYSLANEAIDDRLVVHKGSLAVLTNRDNDWGESFYTLGVKGFGFKSLGEGKLQSFLQSEGFTGEFVEKTSYGSFVAGHVDVPTATRRDWMESQNPITLTDAAWPKLYRITGTGKQMIRNASTGAEMTLPPDAHIVRSEAGILIWTGKPSQAVLYEPSRWTPLARWQAPPTT